MTQFSFTGNYDHYGQAKEQINIAIPRGLDFRTGNWIGNVPTALNRYLATASVTEYAYKNTAALYFTDRATKTTGYDVSDDADDDVFTFKNAIEIALKFPPVAYPITGQTIHYYDGSDLVNLPQFNTLGSHGALTATEVLMLTDWIVTQAYGSSTAYAGNKPKALQINPGWSGEYPQAFRDDWADFYDNTSAIAAGYRYFDIATTGHHRPGSYYSLAERKKYDARGLVTQTADPLHTGTNSRLTEITYDAYRLLPVKVKDPLNLETTAKHDYRVLPPRLVTDANGNRTAARFSPLGLVTEQGVLGKLNANQGDIIKEDPIPDFEGSTKLSYDFYAFHDEGLPVWVKTTQRELHYSQSPASPVLQKVEYSDGFGRLLQTRAQAEDVLFGADAFGSSGLP